MHVLIINHEFPPIGGGAATAAAHLAREMTALGARVTVLTSTFGDLPRHERRDGADIVRVPALRRRADKSGVPEFATFVLSSLIWAVGSRGRGGNPSVMDGAAAPEDGVFVANGERARADDGHAASAREPESIPEVGASASGDAPEKAGRSPDAGESGDADRFDACIAFFGLPGGPAAWLLRLCHGVPYIVSLRGGDVPGFLPRQMALWHRCTGWLIRALWRGAAHVVGNSAGLTALARRAAPDLEILTIPNGVDAACFTPRTENDDPAAGWASGGTVDAVYGDTPPGACRLLFTGRLNGQKNLPCLLQALVPLRKRAWTLTLVGDGPDRAMLERAARSMGLADRVRFAGWTDRDALPDVLRRADIYVFPSIQEGMPNTVLEAMACGLPVVACRIEGCEELVRHGETGLLIPPDDAPALTDAVARLLDDAELRRRMGREGRRVVEREYTWRATAEQYLALCGGAR